MNLPVAIDRELSGIGLKNILEVVHGLTAVMYMLNGKAFTRVPRPSQLNISLHHLLLQSIWRFWINLLINETEDVYFNTLKSETTLETVVKSSKVSRIREVLDKNKSEVSTESKTGKLWLRYQQMFSTEWAWIKELSLNKLYSVLNHALSTLAPAGHYGYLKSEYMYFQEMNELGNKNSQSLPNI